MEHETQAPSRTRDAGYAKTSTSGPERHERTPAQKATDAAAIADNFDAPLMVVTEAVAQIEAAADAGDIVGWKLAKGRADVALRQVERFAVTAAKVVQDATDPKVRQRLEGAAERLRDAQERVAALRPEPKPATPELTCRDALLAALPPFPFPARWRDPDRQASILAVFSVFQTQMTTSDIEAFRAIISFHKDDEIARRFNQFGEARKRAFLERISKEDIKRPAVDREIKHRAEKKRRTAEAGQVVQQGQAGAEAQTAPAETTPTAPEGNTRIEATQAEPQREAQRAPADGPDRRRATDTPLHGLAGMPSHEVAPSSKASGTRASEPPDPIEVEPDARRMSGGPGTPGPHKNINYDKVGHPLPMLPKGTTVSAIKVGIDVLKDSKPPEITDAVVLGVASGSEAEIFVLNVIAQLGRKERWGSEADLQTAVGFTPANGKAPIGKVTLRIDLAGKASAELLKGSVAGGTSFADLADATAKLKTDFGVSAVTNGSATWTLEELGKVHAALSTMSDRERGALVGVELVREHTLNSDGRIAAGQFSYNSSSDPATGTATRTESLSLADSAFQNDKVSFVGGTKNAAPSSAEAIVHEAGHAVETQEVRDARFATLSAQAQWGHASTIFAQAKDGMLAAAHDFQSKAAAAHSHTKAYRPADRVTMKSYLSAFTAATQALVALSNISTSHGCEAIEAKTVAEIASRKSEKTKLAAAHAIHPALKDFAAAEAAQDAWMAAAQERAQALASVEASQAASNGALAAEEAIHAPRGESKHLAKFVEFVNQHQIEPFTDYARNNWPASPGEFYAEAFSLFHTDPDFMQVNYKPLYNWFATGEHFK